MTDGAPGNGFPGVLHWFGLTVTDPVISRLAGFLLLIVLGGVFGLIFGVLQRGRPSTAGRALLTGLAEARQYQIICFAHVTNQMGQTEGDFEKGEASGSETALSVISQTAHSRRQRETELL